MYLDQISPGIFEINDGNRKIATCNMVPGTSVYGEKLIEIEGREYREWNPRRSKLAAMAIKKFPVHIEQDSRVLYLGASTGTTVGHVSDIVSEGVVYAVEFSSRVMRDLVGLCEMRSNIIPVLSDASRPLSYSGTVEMVDVIFQDIAQPNQAEIAAMNSYHYLKDAGLLMLTIKARSVDTVADPKKIYQSQLRELMDVDGGKFEILKKSELSPFHQDHLAVIARFNR